MAQIQHNAMLSQLVINLGRSLLQFVGEASPWSPASAVGACEAVARLIDKQKSGVSRMVELLNRRGYPIEFGMYPVAFTDLHFLSLKSLLPRVILSQETLVAELDEAIYTCVDDPEAEALFGEVLFSERAGTEELKSLKV